MITSRCLWGIVISINYSGRGSRRRCSECSTALSRCFASGSRACARSVPATPCERVPLRTDDALRNAPDVHFDVVITNPPFGKKSSITVVTDDGELDKAASATPARTSGRPATRPEGRWRSYTYDEIIARDKASLDIFWLRDESLEDSDNLPDPHVLAAEIVDDLRAALEQIQDVLESLSVRASK